MASRSFPVKTTFQGDVRRFQATSFENLEDIVREVYRIEHPGSVLAFRYIDTDGDLITVGSTRELEASQTDMGEKIIKLTVVSLVREEILAKEEQKHDTSYERDDLEMLEEMRPMQESQDVVQSRHHRRALDGVLLRCHNELRPFVMSQPDPFQKTRAAFVDELEKLILKPTRVVDVAPTSIPVTPLSYTSASAAAVPPQAHSRPQQQRRDSHGPTPSAPSLASDPYVSYAPPPDQRVLPIASVATASVPYAVSGHSELAFSSYT